MAPAGTAPSNSHTKQLWCCKATHRLDTNCPATPLTSPVTHRKGQASATPATTNTQPPACWHLPAITSPLTQPPLETSTTPRQLPWPTGSGSHDHNTLLVSRWVWGRLGGGMRDRTGGVSRSERWRVGRNDVSHPAPAFQ